MADLRSAIASERLGDFSIQFNALYGNGDISVWI